MKVYAAYGSNINLEQMTFRCPAAQIRGHRGASHDIHHERGPFTWTPLSGATGPWDSMYYTWRGGPADTETKKETLIYTVLFGIENNFSEVIYH
jgi:DUF971 family protein